MKIAVWMAHWSAVEVYENWDEAYTRKEELIRLGAKYEEVRLSKWPNDPAIT